MSFNYNQTRLIERDTKKNEVFKTIMQYKAFYFMLAPAFIWVFIFRYVPMYGVLMAFVDYNFSQGILGSAWNEFKHFKVLFSSDMFLNALKNTVIISLLKMTSSYVLTITLSILITEVKNRVYKRTLQTLAYLPHFVSWVVYGALVTIMLSPETGIINRLIEVFGGSPIYFLSDERYFRSLLVITNVLKEVGWGTIIYVAAIAGIDPTLYEVAVIDGANKLKQIFHITLPSILPTIVIMLILSLGNVLEAGTDQVINMYNPAVLSVGDILGTYVYRLGIEQFEIGTSTAAGLFQSVVGLVLVLVTNSIAKNVNDMGIL